jgi:hypothetical protein
MASVLGMVSLKSIPGSTSISTVTETLLDDAKNAKRVYDKTDRSIRLYICLMVLVGRPVRKFMYNSCMLYAQAHTLGGIT